jgi:hypothetical protein
LGAGIKQARITIKNLEREDFTRKENFFKTHVPIKKKKKKETYVTFSGFKVDSL